MNNFRKINKDEAKILLDKVLFKTFFHDIEWQGFLEKQFKWLRFEYYLYKPVSPDASQGGNELFFEVARVGKKNISLPFCEYGGPLPLEENIDFKEFEKDVFKEFGQNTKIKFHPRIKIGNEKSDNLTHWIENLKNTSEQELLDSFRKTLRHEIKKAQEHGIKIKKCPASPVGGENSKELKRFYNLYVANLKRKKTVPYPWQIIQFLYQSPSSELLVAIYKGKIIAGDMFLHYSGFVYYFLSASDHKYRNFGAAHLILWEKIKSLIGKDVIFDFGATPKDSSLNVFKKGWRGKEYPILQLGIKKSFEALRSSKLRNLFALLPNFIIKKISSALLKYRI